MYVMRRVTVAAVAVFCAMVSVNGAFAQSLPAEIPPASFRGDQYVDSRGCAFVRVGMGAGSQWIPRVSGSRRPVCGLTPSGVGQPPSSVASAPSNRPQPGVTVIGGAPPPAAPAPAATAAPAQPLARDVATQARPPAVAPRSVATTPRVTVPTPQQPPAAAGACPNLPADIRSYFEGINPRCGPQAVHPGDAVRGAVRGGDRSSALGLGQSGAAPALRQVVRYEVNPPAGYRAAWQDGRLNPSRGLGSALGQRQMEAVWTNTTPRRLVAEAPRGLNAVVARAARPANLVPAELVILRP
jgi:hypothetical protein